MGRMNLRQIAVALAVVACVGPRFAVASDPAPTGPSPVEASAAASPNAAPPVPASTSPAQSDTSPSTPAKPEFKPPSGYKAVQKGGTTVYCKKTTPIGSRVPEQTCYSEAEVKALIAQAEADRALMKQQKTTIGTVGQ